MTPNTNRFGTFAVPAAPVRRAGILLSSAALVVAGLLTPSTAHAQAQGLIYIEDIRPELIEAAAELTNIMAAQGVVATTTTDYGLDPGDLSANVCVFDFQVDYPMDPLRVSRFDAYARGGGSLYLSGEHATFAPRNDSIASFVSSLGGGTIVPDPISTPAPGAHDIWEAMNPDHPLATDCNAVTQVDCDGIANGHFLQSGTGTWVAGSPTYAAFVSWDPGSLSRAPGARVVAGLDINAFATGAAGTLDWQIADRTLPTENRAFVENLVQFLCNPSASCSKLCEPRNHGYWHRYCLGTDTIDPGRNGQGNGPGPSKDTDSLPANLIDKINLAMAPYAMDGCAALDDGPFSDPRQAALREYATLKLNLLAGYLTNSCPIELRPVDDRDNLKVSDAVLLMEQLVAAGTEDGLRDAIWVGEHVNNGEALVR